MHDDDDDDEDDDVLCVFSFFRSIHFPSTGIRIFRNRHLSETNFTLPPGGLATISFSVSALSR